MEKQWGRAAIASVTGGPLAFGNVWDLTTSPTLTLTLHNTGTANLTGINAQLDPLQGFLFPVRVAGCIEIALPEVDVGDLHARLREHLGRDTLRACQHDERLGAD